MSSPVQESHVFEGMTNHESIALEGQLGLPSRGSLEIEWMLYPDVLEGCPDRHRWHFGQATAHDQQVARGDFTVDLTAESLDARILHVPSKTCLEISDLRISREEGTAQLTIKASGDTRFYGLGEQFVSLQHGGRQVVCESADWWNKQ